MWSQIEEIQTQINKMQPSDLVYCSAFERLLIIKTKMKKTLPSL